MLQNMEVSKWLDMAPILSPTTAVTMGILCMVHPLESASMTEAGMETSQFVVQNGGVS